MKLEAGKEMDRGCVMNWLNEVYVNPGVLYAEYTDEEIQKFAHDALVLLSEQNAVRPIGKVRHGAYPQLQSFCGNCKAMLHGKPKYCSECGRPIMWKGK